jgi:DNA-binding response OmpR family regulator
MSSQPTQLPAILIVEDDLLFSAAVERYLRTIAHDRYDVVHVTDGYAALAELDRRKVPLVITDYHLLASINGLKLSAAIRERAPETRIALITAYATDDMHRAAADAGAEYYLAKPFLLQDLEPIVRTVIGDVSEAA